MPHQSNDPSLGTKTTTEAPRCCCCQGNVRTPKTMSVVTGIVLIALALAFLWQGGSSLLTSMQDERAQKILSAELKEVFSSQDVSLIRADGKTFTIKAEIAATREQQAQGLMFRDHVNEGEGMLFTYIQPQRVSFWMKNTLIPLDMLFIGPDNTIIKIVKNTQPHNETPIRSDGFVLAVLELKGGEADRMGLAVGDKLK